MTLPDLGIEVTKVRADEAWALCPGPHWKKTGKNDTNASWSINLETGAHSCFSCGWGGPYIHLVRWCQEVDDEKATEWIRQHGGIEVAIKKLRGRKAFEKEEAIEVTEADMALFDDPPKWAREDRDLDLEACHAYGIRWDSETDRWIFPIREPYTNKLLGWQEKGKGVFLNYPKNVEKARCLFGFDLLLQQPRKGRTAYLYESPPDCARLHTYGLDGCVSSYGVHISDIQMELLADEVDVLYVCLDNDGAGRSKEAEIWRDWRHEFKQMWFVEYEGIREKDHGDMDIRDVEWSLTNSISATRFRP